MENGKIYEAISNVMAEIGAIGKDKKNQQQGFMYRGIDDVMNALQPALVKHKVFITPEVINEIREERTNKNGTLLFYTRLEMCFKFYTSDGSFIETKVIGEAMDSGDKATNKAMSIAYKYACFQVFCIPTEEMQDADAEVHEPSPKKQTKSEKPNTKPNTDAKSTPASVPSEEDMAKVSQDKIGDTKIAVIKKELERTGVAEKAICARYKVSKLDDLTEELFIKAMNALKNTKTKGAA
ncbi:MAG: hypothetical protein K0R92_2809 [Lachnospiraceae bacterium]|nr:hypothetical protein [Lachnospiraceae bacterium]